VAHYRGDRHRHDARKLYADAAAYIFNLASGILEPHGPLGGILIADYWVVRRQQLLLDDLFASRAYTYSGGVNPRRSRRSRYRILPVVPGFLRAAGDAWRRPCRPEPVRQALFLCVVLTFGLSFMAYLALMRGTDAPARPNHLTTETQRAQRATDGKLHTHIAPAFSAVVPASSCASVVKRSGRRHCRES